MSVMASWLNNTWGVSYQAVKPIIGLSTSYAVKKVTDNESGQSKVRGHELQPLSFSYDVALAVGVDPRAEYEKMAGQVGKHSPFYLAGRRFGPRRFQLDGVGFDNLQIDNNGNILIATITLDFVEYSSEKSSDKNQDDRLQIIYNSVDIYGDISVNQCIHDMYAASRSDEVLIKFNDTNRMWDGWKPGNNDTIEIINGAARTGKMFIESVKPENGAMVLRGFSIPMTAKNKSNKSWESVKLSQLGKEIADRHKLKFEMYKVTDQLYTYVSQNNVGDFKFLEYRCSLEGIAFIVYDGTLVMYDEMAMEAQTPKETLKAGPDSKYEYKNDATAVYGRSEVVNGQLTGIFDAKNGKEKMLREVLKLQTGTQAEANRFARGRLRYHNKNTVTGILNVGMLREFAAGSVVNVQTTGAGSWDGAAFIYQIRHDYVAEKSKVFFRKPLEGY